MASKGVVFHEPVQAHVSGGGTRECVSVMQPAVGYGVTSISEPVTREPWRAGIGSSTVRQDYRCNAKMLEPSSSHRWAWRITVNQELYKFGRETVTSLCKKLLQMHNRGCGDLYTSGVCCIGI
jgi:hypothetical protein